jgi:3-methyladenine DNA glycosylase AlkD
MASAPAQEVTAAEIQARLEAMGDADDARFLQRYFRTGPGEYGEGDRFLGIRVPALRRLIREYRGIPLREMETLLRSPWHEARLLALLLMVDAFARADDAGREAIHRAYLACTRHINNWDLVDLSAPQIVGAQLEGRDRSLLDRLAVSQSLWERRIAMLATLHFIRRGDFAPTLHVAEMLVGDRHDLIHKAVGWMLREVANRDREAAESFLRRHHRTMPRTMLRYAIEKFPDDLRRHYMQRDG